jgi:hypothetical protein
MKQLRSDALVVDRQRVLLVNRITISETPLTDTLAARRYLGIGIAPCVEPILGPDIDRMGGRTATMIKINRAERIIRGQHVRDAVAVAGLHSR